MWILYNKSHFSNKQTTRGGYSTLVWVGVCRWDFWNATHPCTYFEGKVTHPCTKNQNFSLKFAPFWRKFRKILKSWPIKVPNLRHFGANFRKFWKIDPSKYHVFEKKDPLMYLAAWFCYPCLRHIPITTFVLSTPPGTNKKPYYFLDITHVWALKVCPALLMLHATLVW